MHDSSLSLAQAASLSGVSYPRANSWEKAGLIPLVPLTNRGRGHERRVDFCGVLAIRVIERCTELGVPPVAIRSLIEVLKELSPTKLQQVVRSGRRYLVLGNRAYRLVAAASLAKATASRSPLIIDVGAEIDAVVQVFDHARTTTVGA